MKKSKSDKLKKQNHRQLIFLLLVITIIFNFTAVTALAAKSTEKKTADKTANQTQNLVSDLGQPLEESLNAEEKSLVDYKEELTKVERNQIYLTAALNGYRLQLSAYGNLLLSGGVDISMLQKTQTELKSSLVAIKNMINEISPMVDKVNLERKKLEQQQLLVAKQIAEIAKIKPQDKKDPITPKLQKMAKKLESVLNEKKKLVLRLDSIYQKNMKDMSEIETAFSTLKNQFDAVIKLRQAKNLFERKKEVIFEFKALNALRDDINTLIQKTTLVLQPKFWITFSNKLWESARFVAVSFIFVLCIGFFIFKRIKASVSLLQTSSFTEKLGKWHRFTASILTKSVVIGGMILIVFLYSQVNSMYLLSSALKMTICLLLTILLFIWVKNTLLIVGQNRLVGEHNVQLLIKFFKALVIFSLIYSPTYIIFGENSGLLVLFRIIGAIWLCTWSLTTWRKSHFSELKMIIEEEKKAKLTNLGFKYFLVMLSGVTLMLDISGYGPLSDHWLLSWGKSMIIIFWWSLLFGLIKEWDQYYKEKHSAQRNELIYNTYPIQWLMIRACQFCWLISFMILLLLSWGTRQTILTNLYKILSHPLTIGSMKFSLAGVFCAAFVLLITYALTRIWKWIFQSKFLSRSGMDVGLQDSITTISIYAIWLFGILISLHVFGLNTASLAVAFGALGIGLGFGLQNIFNNFISGIILLFERPIQVGDDVEINGTWAQVRKINVRSTLVQSYDNASLIIPNADFISNQVVNWSFKDKRIRRHINVGVAYGSDVKLVRDTLLEIAKTTPKVLRIPKPEVLFKDFGDSALMFTLRVWTDIDNMIKVENDIRFKIDELFRERKIEISFPQRDIHIRTITGFTEKNTDQLSTKETII